MALAADRNTPERNEGRTKSVALAAAVKAYGGALICRNTAGYGVPGSAAVGLVAQGIAVEQVDNTAGAAGALSVTVRQGEFRLSNSAGGDAITIADIGQTCFIVDDQTVARTDNAGARSPAGEIADVDALGVWVKVGVGQPVRQVHSIHFAIPSTELLAGTAIELISPVAGEIERLSVIVQTAIDTGGDVTVKSGATDVDGLTCTVANAATKGTVVRDASTAGHASRVVAAGGRIQIVPSAAFATAGALNGVLDIVY